ncbi:MAG TPA: DUF6714 family protein [Gallionellaceae bacterium]|nr:DUF6714 family protein [Gallionellaceae bacterium]
MVHSDLIARAFEEFSIDVAATPTITLRGGNALDDYMDPAPFDPLVDEVSESYIEEYPWGIGYLDAASWRHYLPYLIEFSIKHINGDQGDLVVNSFLNSLRPPDRDPPRLAALNSDQEAVITTFLDTLAFSEQSAYQDHACQVLEEWWVPNALYRGQHE